MYSVLLFVHSTSQALSNFARDTLQGKRSMIFFNVIVLLISFPFASFALSSHPFLDAKERVNVSLSLVPVLFPFRSFFLSILLSSYRFRGLCELSADDDG